MRQFTRRGQLPHQLRYLVALGCVVALLALTSLALRPSFDTSHPSSDPVFVQLELRVVAGQRRKCPASPADVLFRLTLRVAIPLSLLAGAAFWALGRPWVGPAVVALFLSLHFLVIPTTKRQALALDDRRDVSAARSILCRLDGWIVFATILALATIHHWPQICGMGMPLVGLQTTTQTHKANVPAPGIDAGGVDHYRVRSTITADGDRLIEIRQSITIQYPHVDKDFDNILMVLLSQSVGPDGGRYLDQATIGHIFGISRQMVNVRISTYNRSQRIVDVTSGRRHDAPDDPRVVKQGAASMLDDSLTEEGRRHLSAHDVVGRAVQQEEPRSELASDDQIADEQQIRLATSFRALLQPFERFFQRRSAQTFRILVAGWILTTGRRTITAVIRTVKGYEIKSFSRFHAFFSQAKWSFVDLWLCLFTMYLDFVPTSEKIPLDGDDTLARKKGNHICGAGMHHDPLHSRPKRVFLHFGHNWVALAAVLRLPFMGDKGIPIPLLAQLYRPKKDCKRLGIEYRTHTQMMREMVTMVASWAPERSFVFAGDSAYGCAEVVKHLPTNVECVSRVRMDAALYKAAPSPEKAPRGRPPKKGERLPTPKTIADDPKTEWTKISAFLYGRSVTTTVKVIQALWYTTAGARPLLIVVVRDPSGKRHDEAFFSTDLTMTPKQVVERYALRWPLETLFRNAKQCMGFEDPQNRTDQAVERTAPFALFLTGVVALWFAWNWRTAERSLPQVGPWYNRKDEVGISFEDMLGALRQMSHREMIMKEADGTLLPRKFLELVLHLLGTLA